MPNSSEKNNIQIYSMEARYQREIWHILHKCKTKFFKINNITKYFVWNADNRNKCPTLCTNEGIQKIEAPSISQFLKQNIIYLLIVLSYSHSTKATSKHTFSSSHFLVTKHLKMTTSSTKKELLENGRKKVDKETYTY